jgi:hypothetical protein
MIFVKLKGHFTLDMTEETTGLPELTEWMDATIEIGASCLNGGFIYRVTDTRKSNGIYGFTEGVGEGWNGKICTVGKPTGPGVPCYSYCTRLPTTAAQKTNYTKIEKKFDGKQTSTYPTYIGPQGVLYSIRCVVTRTCHKCKNEIHPEDTHKIEPYYAEHKIQKGTDFKKNLVSCIASCQNCM